jgi:hypothetical protein
MSVPKVKLRAAPDDGKSNMNCMRAQTKRHTHLPKQHADCKENLHDLCQEIHTHWAEEELPIHF